MDILRNLCAYGFLHILRGDIAVYVPKIYAFCRMDTEPFCLHISDPVMIPFQLL